MKRIKSLFVAGAVGMSVLAWPGTALAQEPTTVRIVHTNDIHGRFVQSGSAIGIDTVATIYQSLDNAIFVDAGDTIHGLPFVNLNYGANAIDLMNMAGLSVMVPGNHEFNFGWQRLVELEQQAEFPFIAANVYQSGELLFTPYQVFEVGGVNLGFFGLATPDTPVTTHPNNVAGIEFTNPVDAAQSAVASLQEAGADIIIALSHLGMDPQNRRGPDFTEWPPLLAQNIDGLSLIIDGHSHTAIHGGYWLENDVFLVQAGEHGEYVGVVEIELLGTEIQGMTSRLIDLEYALENFEPDPEISNNIQGLSGVLDEAFQEIVGYMPMTIYGDGGGHRDNLRSREVPIGNLVADSMMWATDADMAIMNSGGIRYHFYAGETTVGDVVEVLAFPNFVIVIEATPALLREALENGVSLMPGNGRFPQVGGLSFVFDQDAEYGQRIVSISVGGEELDLEDTETTFTLAINDFKAAGGDGYTMFIDLPYVSQAGTLSEIFINFLRANEITLDQLALQGRITNIAEGATPAYEPQDAPQDEPQYQEAVTIPAELPDDVIIPAEPADDVTIPAAIAEPTPPMDEAYVPAVPAPVAPAAPDVLAPAPQAGQPNLWWGTPDYHWWQIPAEWWTSPHPLG